ncbi:hypothetical protein [Citrobacter koseri]|uniref:hypothetical protein n=1 Tax=Citrobacter koseri TaxID=545 RepID=UPI00397D234C
MLSFAKLQENHDKRLEHEQIDSILSIIKHETISRIEKLQQTHDELTEESFAHPSDVDSYRDMLIEDMIETDNLQKIAEELAIMSLFKNIEIKISNVVKRLKPNKFKRNLGKTISCIIPNIKDMMGFDSYNELRLINNAIKHDGKVTQELSLNYPQWIEGDILKELDCAYNRLLPGSKAFVRNVVTEIYNSDE